MKGTAIFYPSEHISQYCSVYTCSNHVKWTICGENNTHIAYMGTLICNECAQNMIDNLPLELVVRERDIRSEIDAEINQKVEEVKAEHETEIEKLYKKWAAENAAAPTVLAARPVEKVVAAPPAKPINEGIFRCLDCDKEFDNKRALSNHMRIHEGVKV